MSPAASSFLDIDPGFCSGLAYKIYIRGGPSVYVNHVKAAPYVRSVDCVFAYFCTLDNDSECPMDYETSLLPNVIPSHFQTQHK